MILESVHPGKAIARHSGNKYTKANQFFASGFRTHFSGDMVTEFRMIYVFLDCTKKN